MFKSSRPPNWSYRGRVTRHWRYRSIACMHQRKEALYNPRCRSAMRGQRIICGLLILTFCAGVRFACPQSSLGGPDTAKPLNFNVAVDEVSLTFHAGDVHGLPINDLRLDELNLLDNGKPPHKILAFYPITNLPIRAGILIDKSESMEEHLTSDRAILNKYARLLLQQQTDQAFVMDFSSRSGIAEPWTSDTSSLVAAVGEFMPVGRGLGTAIFDAVNQACFYEFGKIDPLVSGNLILLFSDGEDNASKATLRQAIEMCQRTNTSIYVFRAASQYAFSTGPKALAELASETGGRVFYDDDSDAVIDVNLRIIEGNLRNQYRLIYNPPELKHDGSFHQIDLKAASARVGNIVIRSGYYAAAH
jgi:Ca-activated chloride channel homolog